MNTRALSHSYDVVIVGARCAGAATALLLARGGARVLVIDRGRYGTDTLSTHALMRTGVHQMHRWGLLPRLLESGVPPVHTTSFHYGDETVEIPIKKEEGVDALFGPRRYILDALLVDAAREAGARVEYGMSLADLLRSQGGRVNGVVVRGSDGDDQPIQADLVIGADGVRSTTARLVGSEIRHSGRYAAATLYGYYEALDHTGYHWYYRPGVSAGTIPTHQGMTCVFVAVSDSRFRQEVATDVSTAFPRLLEECAPSLAARVGPAGREGTLRGFPGVTGFLRRCTGPGWALVGDAGYFKDPITAHGISDAFRDAEILARAVLAGTETELENYQTVRDDLSGVLLETTDFIASFEWDLQSLQELHLLASREMGRELEYLKSLPLFETRKSAIPA